MRAFSLVGSLRFVATRSMHDVFRHLGARSAPASLLSENWLTYIYVGNVSVNTLFIICEAKLELGHVPYYCLVSPCANSLLLP
jgi:hypothetical protein